MEREFWRPSRLNWKVEAVNFSKVKDLRCAGMWQTGRWPLKERRLMRWKPSCPNLLRKQRKSLTNLLHRWKKICIMKPTTDSRFWTSVKMIVVKPIARKRLSKVLKRNTAEPNKKKLTSRVVKISQVTENQLQYQKAKLGKLLPPAPRQRWKYNHRDCRGFLNETSGCKKTWTFNKESKHTRSKYGCDKTPC